MAPKFCDQSRKASSLETNFDKHYHQVYSGEAKEYDNNRFSKPKDQKFHADELAQVIELLHLQPGQTLLDVAGGTGRFAIPIAKQNQVTILDLTHAMMQQAQAKADTETIGGIDFVEGNARMLPFADQQFDAVMAIRFLHLLPVALYRPLILEMIRVLRSHGVLLVEFNSALAGGIILPWSRVAFQHLTRKDNQSYMIWPHQISQVFAGLGNITLHGFWSPGGYLLSQLNAECATNWERRFANGWRSFLAWHVFVRVVKPIEPRHSITANLLRHTAC